MSATTQPSYTPPVAQTYRYLMLNVQVDSLGTYTVIGENDGNRVGGFEPAEQGPGSPNHDLVATLNRLGEAAWEIVPVELPIVESGATPIGPIRGKSFQILLRQRTR
jgi:hypothetical protein